MAVDINILENTKYYRMLVDIRHSFSCKLSVFTARPVPSWTYFDFSLKKNPATKEEALLYGLYGLHVSFSSYHRSHPKSIKAIGLLNQGIEALQLD